MRRAREPAAARAVSAQPGAAPGAAQACRARTDVLARAPRRRTTTATRRGCWPRRRGTESSSARAAPARLCSPPRRWPLHPRVLRLPGAPVHRESPPPKGHAPAAAPDAAQVCLWRCRVSSSMWHPPAPAGTARRRACLPYPILHAQERAAGERVQGGSARPGRRAGGQRAARHAGQVLRRAQCGPGPAGYGWGRVWCATTCTTTR